MLTVITVECLTVKTFEHLFSFCILWLCQDSLATSTVESWQYGDLFGTSIAIKHDSNKWPQLNSKVGHETDFTPPPPPPPPPTTHPPHTQCHQYLSCAWPDFNQTLKVGLWDQQQPYKQQQQEQEQQKQYFIYRPDFDQTFNERLLG